MRTETRDALKEEEERRKRIAEREELRKKLREVKGCLLAESFSWLVFIDSAAAPVEGLPLWQGHVKEIT